METYATVLGSCNKPNKVSIVINGIFIIEILFSCEYYCIVMCKLLCGQQKNIISIARDKSIHY
ncbi:hypothetical protein M6B38_305165 [Iris pallida]|uniref:Uncharacterized protein n=1 Tax=Iris pallida TaxID=29817 RepID=A0AAX6HN69_IRIPA|nr:hypothetical protein M6B38_305165 [Iris pallida]